MAFESLTERLNGVFKKLRGKGKLNEADIKAAMREVRMALLEADVNYKVAKDFCAQVSERAMGQEVMESLTPAQQVVKIVNEELTNLMGGNEPKYLRLKNKGQTVLMMCGLQGNGKTTHAAKLGKYYRSQGRRPLLVACDIYRPAAIEQLKVVGEQAGVLAESQSRDDGLLQGSRRADSQEVVYLLGALNDGRGRNDVAQPPARDRVGLGQRRAGDRPLPHTGQRGKIGVGVRRVDDVLVHLVGDNIDIILFGKARNQLQLVPGEHLAAGV